MEKLDLNINKIKKKISENLKKEVNIEERYTICKNCKIMYMDGDDKIDFKFEKGQEIKILFLVSGKCIECLHISYKDHEINPYWKFKKIAKWLERNCDLISTNKLY